MNPYTNPTAEGYAGVWKARYGGVRVPLGAFDGLSWTPENGVVAVTDDIGLRLTDQSDSPARLGALDTTDHRNSRVVRVPKGVTRHIPGFDGDGDVRGYARDGDLVLVDGASDPLVGEGTEVRADGGTDTPDPTTIIDPAHTRRQPGDGTTICADCSDPIRPGHAITASTDGLTHEDCTDPWCDLFEGDTTDLFVASTERPGRECPTCDYSAATEAQTCPDCGATLYPSAVAFNREVSR